MKKISILPLAEKTEAGEIYTGDCSEDKFKIKIPFCVYLILFCVMMVSLFISPVMLFMTAGILLILAGIDSGGITSHSGRVVENNLWNNLPFLIIGISIVLITIAVAVSPKTYENGVETRHPDSIGKIIMLILAVTAAIMIGRFIYLVITAFAIADRKRACTCPVSVEPGGNTAFYSAVPQDTESVRAGRSIYKYYYEGETYWFIDHENHWSSSYDPKNTQIYIDLNEPERYYEEQLFSENAKKLKGFLITLLFIVLIILVIRGVGVIKNNVNIQS
jgi:YHS domain-containing protein